MGTTFSSIHIYSENPVDNLGNFRSFSKNWHTYLPDEEPENPFDPQKLARKISRDTDAPVLWFYIFDSESISFDFYQKGRKVAGYAQMNEGSGKNLYGIPELIGYESSQKRRLSKILACSDTEFQVQLLEEYFGVCLLPVPELYEVGHEAFVRVRGNAKYQAYLEEERKLSGKNAPIRATLVWETPGKLFQHEFNGDVHHFRRHHYFFGYDTFESNFEDGNLRMVRFEQGQLIPITREEFEAVPKIHIRDAHNDDPYDVEWNPSFTIHFTGQAPKGFQNKTYITPRGYYPHWFDPKGRLILTDQRGGLLFVDSSLSVIAKIGVKGIPADYVDGYLLTVGSESGFAYCYHPTNYIRIYQLHDT